MSDKDDEEANQTNLGYQYYPERGDKSTRSFFNMKKPSEFRLEQKQHDYCEEHVLHAIYKNPFIKFLKKAMESQGCKLDLTRHICCEQCSSKVVGGFDQRSNQIVMCENMLYKNPYYFNYTLAHEMTHMFDYCRADTKFQDLEHLACAEIRAVNIYGCPVNKFKHCDQELCVKNVAALSVMAARNVSEETALEAVESVFDKCYNDLEPFGRKLKSPGDMEKVYQENCRYGFYDMHAPGGRPLKMSDILRKRSKEIVGAFVRPDD